MTNDRLKLRRKIDTDCFECIATFRSNANRPDIEALMGLLKEYQLITPELIIEHMLPDKPLAMAKNLISRYMELGFLDENGKAGLYAKYALDGDIMLPERGKYKIFATPDPVILQRIIKVSYLDDSDRKKEVGNGQNKTVTANPPKPMPIPDYMRDAEGIKCLVWFDGRKNIVLESIEPMGIPLSDPVDISLEVELGHNFTRVFLSNPKEKESITMVETPPLGLEVVWKQILLDPRLAGWTGGPLDLGKLEVSFEETTPQERETFTRMIQSFQVFIDRLEIFRVDGFSVSVSPGTKKDAEKWAEYAMLSKINDYLADKEYIVLSAMVENKFKEFDLKMPERDELLQKVDEHFHNSKEEAMRKRWYLRAPVDLTEV